MKSQTDLFYKDQRRFDLPEGILAKEAGMALANKNKRVPLEVARGIAVSIAREGDGTCDADRVMEVMINLGYTPGPWAGSIFKHGGWEFTGERRLSRRVNNHARELKIWRYLKFA